MPRVLRSQEGRERKVKRLKMRLVLYALLLISIIAGLSYASFRPALSVTAVEVRGSSAIPAEDIKSAALTALAGSHFGLFSRGSALLYPKGEIRAILTDTFTRAENFSLELEGLNTLVVEVKEREGQYVWCGKESLPHAPTHTPHKTCLFLDQSGYAFDAAPVFSDNTYLEFYGGAASSTFALREQYLQPEEFSVLLQFVEETRKIGPNPVKIFFSPKGLEGFVEIYAKEGWKIILRPDMNIQKFVENLTAIARAPKWQEAVKGVETKEGKLEYLDFRFGNKVYYRFIN